MRRKIGPSPPRSDLELISIGRATACLEDLTIALPLLYSRSSLGNSCTLLGLFRFADVSRSWRGRDSAWNKVEDGPNSVENIVLSGQLFGICQRQVGS